jgi:tetratricopeptide (TPR) repeat protein
MSQTPTLALSVLIAAAAAAAVSWSMRPAAAATPPSDVSADVQREISELRAACAALRTQLETMHAAPMQASFASATERSTATEEQIAAAVEAALKRREAKASKDGAVATTGDLFDLEKDFAGLVGTSYWEDPEKWKKAFAAGRMDEVIAQFEAQAKANPNDVKTQMDLANAYMAYLQLDQSKWQYSMKADEVFDKVLTLDEGHWEARFTKAMSYTFWPDFLGKRKDAISNFETLVSQQEKLPVEEHHAQTYLFLGNLLEQSDPAKARDMWQKGARRHPNNAELRKKAGG